MAVYAHLRGEPSGISIYRDGNHHYSYTSRRDRRKRTVLAVASLEHPPLDFVSDQAHSIKGMYVYCPEDAGKDLPTPQKSAEIKSSKKEVER